MKTRKCAHFCKKDYVPTKFNKFYNKSSKQFLRDLSPQEKTEYFQNETNSCKMSYCNPKCDGFSDQLKNLKRKNGFRTTYSKKRVAELKKRGALSGCIYDNVRTYDVFHK